MIWKIDMVDPAFIASFIDAGTPDQGVIDAFLTKTRRKQHAPKHTGVKRWYYFQSENPRITLVSIGRPLSDLADQPVKMIIGTHEIIGEFPGNQAFIGQKGLKLQCEPIEWLQGNADREFATGSQALAAISEQVLDLRRAEQIQQEITEKYQWKK